MVLNVQPLEVAELTFIIIEDIPLCCDSQNKIKLSPPRQNITKIECVWNVMAHAQKSGFVFRRNGRVHLNRQGRQFSRLLAAEVCASAVVMLDTPCSEVVWSVLATHSICQFPLHFPSRASPCAIRFQTHCTFLIDCNHLYTVLDILHPVLRYF
jgi:hypothetical protein